MFETHEFSYDKAVHFAKLSQLAYAEPDAADPMARAMGYTEVKFFDNDGAEAYGLAREDVVVIAFRGTQPTQFNDIKADLKTRKEYDAFGCRVHRGFKCEVDDIWEEIQKWLATQKFKQVYTTGHSLGGAMSTIAATRLPKGTIVYNYGSPRVGTGEFAARFDEKYTMHRFVNNNDIVPRVPFMLMGYRHAGELHYINTYGNICNATLWQRLIDRIDGYRHALKKGEKFDDVYDHDIGRYISRISSLNNKSA